MTGEEAVYTLKELAPDLSLEALTRAVQTAKQIGSSWPKPNINLIYIDYNNDHDFWRMVIE